MIETRVKARSDGQFTDLKHESYPVWSGD